MTERIACRGECELVRGLEGLIAIERETEGKSGGRGGVGGDLKPWSNSPAVEFPMAQSDEPSTVPTWAELTP